MNTIPELIDRWNAIEGKVTLAVYWSEVNMPPAVRFKQKSMTFAAYKKLCATHGAKDQAAWLPRVPKQGYASVLVGLQGFAYAFIISSEGTTAATDEVVQLCRGCAETLGQVHRFSLADNWLLTCRDTNATSKIMASNDGNEATYDLAAESLRILRGRMAKPRTWTDTMDPMTAFPDQLPNDVEGVAAWLTETLELLRSSGHPSRKQVLAIRLRNVIAWLNSLGCVPDEFDFDSERVVLEGHIISLLKWVQMLCPKTVMLGVENDRQQKVLDALYRTGHGLSSTALAIKCRCDEKTLRPDLKALENRKLIVRVGKSKSPWAVTELGRKVLFAGQESPT
ncbi:MAG: hypothetical protein R3E01_26345 [Pirellulaceae bacterium]